MRGHKYEIELGGSRCADLTEKKCPRFISKASAQRQSAPKGGREGGREGGRCLKDTQ